MKPRVTSWAVGMPKNVQLSRRRFSSRNRVVPYQTRKISSRSPEISFDDQRAAEPDQEQRAEDPRDRLVQEQRVEVGRLGEPLVQGTPRSGGRSRSLIPHGRVVGGPYSSWLKKFPQRPIACMTNRPGATTSAHCGKLWCLQRMYSHAAIVPVTIPPGTPSPVNPANARAVGLDRDRQERRERVGLVQLPLVDDVVQPAADQGRDRDDDQSRSRRALVQPAEPASRRITTSRRRPGPTA